MKIWYVIAKINGQTIDNFIASFTEEEALSRFVDWVEVKFGVDAKIENLCIQMEEDLTK